MFEVGFTEIVLILGLALLVLGPEKLPGLAEKIGRWTGRARAMARQLRTQLEQEVNLDELSKSRPMHSSGTASADYSASAAPDAAEAPQTAGEESGGAHPDAAPGPDLGGTPAGADAPGESAGESAAPADNDPATPGYGDPGARP